MVKTEDSNKETFRNLLIPDTEKEIISFDAVGNFKCSRCGFTHTTTECAEYRLVHANRELEKVNQFVQMIAAGCEGETPVDTLIRAYQKLHADQTQTEVTELLKEE